VIYEAICGNTLGSFKIADAAGLSLRRLTRGMVLAFAITLPLALVAILTGIYHCGWLNLRGLRVGWLGGQAIGDGERIIWLALTHAPGPDVNGIVALSLGAGIALFLGAMRLQYWWWPFYPVGFMAAMCWGMHWYWAAFPVGWACKTLVVRYGGLKLYSRTLPLATGLIVGDLAESGSLGRSRIPDSRRSGHPGPDVRDRGRMTRASRAEPQGLGDLPMALSVGRTKGQG